MENKDKYKIISISMRTILKTIDFNEFLINKRSLENRNYSNSSITFALPNEVFHYVNSNQNRTKYIIELIKKYRIFLKNIKNEVFIDFSEFMRFFILLDFIEFKNDIKLEINSSFKETFLQENIQVKNGYFTEIVNGIEYLIEYQKGKMITKTEIRGNA